MICNFCVLDDSDKFIKFDESGRCNYCKEAEIRLTQNKKLKTPELLEKIIHKIKSKNNKYDCLIGISGGVDSSYITLLAKKWGLNALLVHVDSGWNSAIAVKNIETLVDYTGFDLYTVVLDWDEIRDLQLSFIKAGVINIDIPQDHCFVGGVYESAVKFNIEYILNGFNLATESILSKREYRYSDLTHILDIHKKFGTLKIKNLPFMNFFKYNFYYKCVKNIKSIDVLNYIDYHKKKAKEELKKIGWTEYDNKHEESIYTKFLQNFYYFYKFNFDKRKYHLSSLIVSKQIKKSEALEILKNKPHFSKKELEYISDKFNLTLREFKKILDMPIHEHNEYKTNTNLVRLKMKIEKFLPCSDFNKIRY